MSEPVIRPEAGADSRAVYAVNAAAFPTEAEAKLVDALRAAGRAIVSLVAVLDGRVVGHVLFSPVSVETGESGDGARLAPVAVMPDLHRRGIGGALVRAGLAAVAAAGFRYCVVLGDPAYYSRFGFERASAVGLGNEYGVDAEFMVQELTPGGLAGKRGLVRYAPEFAGV